MKNISLTFLLICLTSLTSASAKEQEDQGRAEHDELKAFLECEVKSQKSGQSDCTPPKKFVRKPSQEELKKLEDLKLKELKADKAPIDDYGHPRFFHNQWQTPHSRGGGSGR